MRNSNTKKDKQILKYNNYIKKEAKKFRLTEEDIHNIYDLFYMIEMGKLKLNKMDKWANKFLDRLDKIIMKEDYK